MSGRSGSNVEQEFDINHGTWLMRALYAVLAVNTLALIAVGLVIPEFIHKRFEGVSLFAVINCVECVIFVTLVVMLWITASTRKILQEFDSWRSH